MRKLVFIKILFLFLVCSNVNGQVSNGNMENVVVCGNTSEWEAIVTIAGTVVIDSLPPGIEFVSLVSSSCGATLISSSPPTFDVPSPCTIIYEVQSSCETFIVRDEEQGGNSNLVFRIDFLHNGNSVVPQDVTAETNAPELQIELLSNGSPIDPFTPFSRTFRVCNDGLDSYLDDPIDICFDNGSDLIMNEVRLMNGTGGILLSVTGDCVSITPLQFQFALDRNQSSNGTAPSLFEGGISTDNSINAECLYIDLNLELNSCSTNPDFEQKIKTNWGCNGTNCAIKKNLPVSSNILQDVPELRISSDLGVGDGCNREHFFMDTIFIENIGIGTANNVVVNIEADTDNTMWTFDVGNMMVDDGVNPLYSISATIKDTTALNAGGTEGCLDTFYAFGGLESAIDFEFVLPEKIQGGQTIKVLVPMYFCCSVECREFPSWPRWTGQIDYTNLCGDVVLNEPRRLIEGFFSYRNRTIPVIEPDYNDGDIGEANFDINDFTFDVHFPAQNWSSQPFYELTFPCGISYSGDVSVTLLDGTESIPDSIVWDPLTRELYFDWDHPFDEGPSSLFRAGQIHVGFTTDCATCGGGNKTFEMYEGIILGENCDDFCRLGQCYSFNTTLHCGACPWVGITPDSYSIERTNYGLTDLNDDGLPDDGSIANVSDIRVDRATVGDTLEGTWHANVTTNIEHPFWGFGYAESIMSGITQSLGSARPIGARISFYDENIGDTIHCANVLFDSIDFRTTEFDFSPSSLCAVGCPEFCNRVYEDGDEIWLTGVYEVVDPDICLSARLSVVNLETTMYGAEVANPPVNTIPTCSTCVPIIPPDNRFTCDTYSGTFNLITPFNTIASANSEILDGCENEAVVQSFFLGIGPGSSYFFNLFPREYRAFGIWDTIYVAIPEGYIASNWLIQNRTGAGNGLNNNMNLNYVESIGAIVPDFIDTNPLGGTIGSTVYGFDLKQYYENGIFNFSDDGNTVTIHYDIQNTCQIASGTQDTIEYWGAPRWLLNDQNCGLFGPRSPDLVFNNQPQLILQSEQETVFGECPGEEWPLRIVSQNNANAENVFLHIPPGTLQVNAIEDNTGSPLIENNKIYEVGFLAGTDVLDLTIKADYLTCERDSFLVLLGYDCQDYPASIADYECELDSMWLFLEPQYPDFNLAILQPVNAQEYELCDPITFEFQYRNVGEAKAYNLKSLVFLPQDNADIQDGSLEIEFPCGTGYQNWVSAYPTGVQVPLGTLWSLDITKESRQNSSINLLGDTIDNGWAFPLISEVDNCFNVRFNVLTSCDFKSSEQAVRTLLEGTAPCGIFGDPDGRVVAEIENATSISIAGTSPYAASLTTLVNDTIVACTGNQTMDILFEMLETGPTGPLDSIEIRLPSGITYVSNTTSQTPNIQMEDGLSSLNFLIDPPLTLGETLDFSLEFAINKDSLDCENNIITASSSTIENVQCATEPIGNLCNVFSNTGYSESFFFVDKPNLTADIIQANSACRSSSMDLVYEIEITNNSSVDVIATEEYFVNVYYNFDGSCSIFGNSTLVKTITVNGPLVAGASIIVSEVVTDFQVGACNLIASVNGCSCDNGNSTCSEIIINDLPQNNYSECFPGALQIETCDRDEFTYTWEGIDGASTTWFTSATDIYNPTLDLPDPGNSLSTYQFAVNIDRGAGCRVIDTVTIEVFPFESTSYTGVNQVCEGFDTQLHGPTGFIGTWTPTTNLADPNDPESAVVAPSFGPAIQYVFDYTDSFGCPAEFLEDVFVEQCIDLELSKNLVTTGSMSKGDTLQFELSLMNISSTEATNVVIIDTLPSCLTYNLVNNPSAGVLSFNLNVLTWTIPNITSGSTESIVIDVVAQDIGNCFNDAQVVLADQTDIDSTPNNDDGDQSEDDEDELAIFLCNPNICLPITIIRN